MTQYNYSFSDFQNSHSVVAQVCTTCLMPPSGTHRIDIYAWTLPSHWSSLASGYMLRFWLKVSRLVQWYLVISEQCKPSRSQWVCNHASLLLSFGSLFIVFDGKEIFCLFHVPKNIQIMCHSV